MVKKAIIAIVVIVVVAIVAVGAYVVLSGDNDKTDPNKVTFLIQDEEGVYFWISGSGETALDALRDAFSDYPTGTLETSADGINSIFGQSFDQVPVDPENPGGLQKWIWWVQFTWKDDKWSCNTVGLSSINSKDVEYMLILFGAGNMSDPAATETPEGTPTPNDAKVWDGSTKGTVFQIESTSGLYFKINGTGGNTLLNTLENACEKYDVPIDVVTSSYGPFLSGLFGMTSYQDKAGEWLYWVEFEYKSDGWESSEIGMDGLKSSDNPKYALVFGYQTTTPT
ncbi:MAG: hypothetical protein FWC29_05695 [Methanomassiliicoccaceae archaeon]|nr:hypothetical protein [Methanomassiliicoccaceae archaeon]